MGVSDRVALCLVLPLSDSRRGVRWFVKRRSRVGQLRLGSFVGGVSIRFAVDISGTGLGIPKLTSSRRLSFF